MQKLKEMYAKTLLTTCLKMEKGQPLFISAPIEVASFVEIIANEAYKIGVNDIYFELIDPILKRDSLLSLDTKELKKTPLWDRSKWNEYTNKKAAFLMLVSENPGLMKDVDSKKLNEMTMYQIESKKDFNDARDKSRLAWCIAAVPTIEWAKHVYPNSKNPVDKLWNTIFKICEINEVSKDKSVDKKIKALTKRADILTSLKIQKLTYKNKLGTDFSIELPKNHIWASGCEKLTNGKNVLVNFPTEEVFTSPKYDTANGILYSSKPLCYQDNIIDEFSITFKDGKAISCKAKKGLKVLEQLINSCENSNYLGEVALVPYDSPISNSNTIFYETLFDENAACHIALGSSFPECIKGGTKMNKKELKQNGLNQCDNHVDFMIGTKDLSIIATTVDGKEITIFENGNFTKKFM